MVISTNYKGNLHIGYLNENSSAKCFGTSIKDYRGFFPKLLAKIFNISIEIEMDGKLRSLNIDSLQNHLNSIGLDVKNIEEIKQIGYNSFIQKNTEKIIVSNNRFGENFSEKKRTKLYQKMILQLEVNNTQAVKRLIQKGAYIDREFYKPADGPINGYSVWFNRPLLEQDLRKSYSKTRFYCYTPLAMAAERGNQTLAKFILNVKNGDYSADKKQTVQFEVTKRNGAQTYWKTCTKQVAQVSESNGSVKIA